ncbi:amino acid/amide ABC transporter substrate-binding protein, HAAT family [Desulfonatronum thiosulfatophilum]|uniref:Amino acid/amide ABC transporter substrate-binding protein, HAAT family n=1 Tax=Desulfonatronum thiosulfatophilum TaxID=617002 RepID=A0A1G6BBC7_9BACT|nr:ABC transporter substrate-binding protein [Desulfonatronum thiosulfatophilum]SDB17931.1 amino acid/amide ABC transporter substrate-binding protein, HAAT family [Desulfonatronum thiosulfatophilum]
MKKQLVAFLLIALISLSGPVLAAEPIKIGAFFALSGPAAFIGTPTKLVAEMVVEKINKDGGINGSPLELVVADTESDPQKALLAARRLVEREKVTALVGPTRTDTGMAVKAYLHQRRVPTVMTVGGDPVIMGDRFGPFDWIFKSPQRSSVAVSRVYEYLQSRGVTRVGLLTASDGFGKDGLSWLTSLAGEYGITITANEQFAPTDTDMTTQLVKIRATDPEFIICWTIGPAAALVSKNVQQLGLTIPLMHCHGIPDPKYLELAGDAADGTYMPSTKLMAAEQLSDDDPQKAVVMEFIRLYKDVYQFERQYPMNTHSGYAWDAIMLLAEALRKVGPDDPVAIRDALRQTSGFVGVSGVFTLSEEDHNGLDTDSLIIVKVEQGEWVMQ